MINALSQWSTGIPARPEIRLLPGSRPKMGNPGPGLKLTHATSSDIFLHVLRARRIGHARNLFNLLRGIHKLPGARAPAPTRSILRGSRIRSGSDPGPSRAWEYIKDFRKFLAILTPSPRPQVSEILDPLPGLLLIQSPKNASNKQFLCIFSFRGGNP